MTRSEAERKLETIKNILADVIKQETPHESKTATLRSRAQISIRDVDDVIRLLKKLDRAVKAS